MRIKQQQQQQDFLGGGQRLENICRQIQCGLCRCNCDKCAIWNIFLWSISINQLPAYLSINLLIVCAIKKFCWSIVKTLAEHLFIEGVKDECVWLKCSKYGLLALNGGSNNFKHKKIFVFLLFIAKYNKIKLIAF